MEIIKKTILQAVTTGMTQGFWNAATNVPNITGNTVTGYMWYVSVSGNTPLIGISGQTFNDWNVGDWVTKLDDGWGKVVNGVSGSTGKTLIIPDLSITYYSKIGLKQVGHDIGFFDAFQTENTYPYAGDSEPIGGDNLLI